MKSTIWRHRFQPLVCCALHCVSHHVPSVHAFATMTTDSCTSAIERQWGILETIPILKDNKKFEAFRLFAKDDGTFPNNHRYPMILIKEAFHKSQNEGERLITNGGDWTRPWAWVIFPFHHYHSTAWELLLCVQGQAQVQLGGPAGPVVSMERGDLCLIPPGFAHKQLESSDGFTLLGAYPTAGCSGPVDTLRGTPSAKERTNIETCTPPESEPILGMKLVQFY